MSVEISKDQSGAQQKIIPITERMKSDMVSRGYSPMTQKIYLRAVRHLSRHYAGRSPELISLDEAKHYLRLKGKTKISKSALLSHELGVRFLFEITFGKTWKPVSPLRQRMIDGMDMKGFSVRTQVSYVRSVAALCKFYDNRSPKLLTDEEIRSYFVHLKVKRKLARQTVTIALSGIKFIYETTLKRDFSLTGIPVPKGIRDTQSIRTTRILSPCETRRLLIGTPVIRPGFDWILTTLAPGLELAPPPP